ncbi:dedicator of cytokinesis protein 3, partial [Biomphalaria pfeifferi]
MSGIWKPARHKYGVVTSNFVANTINQALQLYIGETVHVLEEYWPDPKTDKVTWLRGCTISNKNKKGIFPCCYIAFKECAVENEGPFETVTPVEDAVITEIIFVLREWNTRWKMLFVERKQLFQTILLVMGELAKYRAQLASSTLTREKALEQKHSAIIMMDWGNSQLGLDLVPRVEYQQADPDQLSVVEMFRIHEQSVHNCQGAWIAEEPNGMMKVIPRDNQNEKIFHLLITLCNLGCDIGDNAEVYLSLYDNTSSNFISERFVMHFIKTKQTEASDKSLSTIFTDLVADDLRRDIYLVVQIFRKGRLNSEGSFKKLPVFQYRRPWGISVLCLKDLFQIQPEAELEYFLSVHCVDNENFFNMHESLIRRQVQLLGKSLIDKQNQGITLSVKILHGDMKNVKIDNPMLFNKPSVVLTQRMGFSEFINPGEVRNDLYLTLIGADFDRGSKTASKNIEARVTVNNHNYEIIKDCILSASGDQMSSTFFSYVLYHSNTPKWQETIRLSIPIEKFNVAHVRIELCHCSNRDKAEKKMYGFAFLSLTKQGNIAQEDGKYDLRIYKCDDSSKVRNYLRLPYLRDESEDFKKSSNEHCPYQQSSREFLSIRTLLCSTKFAQKTELLNVLQWRSNPSKILYHLDSLIKLKGQELVRYLQDVLDALFDMFTAGEKEQVPFAMEIFQTLVHIFNLLHEDKFKKFSDVLEEYLQKSFSSPLAHRDLMLCLKKQAERIYTCSDFDESNSRKVFKVIGDIFKFAVQSCIISKRINADQPVKEFKRNLNLVFDTLGNVLKSTEVVLHKAQAYILSNLHKCFIPLLHVESLMELAQIVKFLLSRVNVEPGSKVTKAKTSLVKHVINSPLFQDAASRNMLLPLCLAHIRKCLVNKKNLDLTANTLGDLLSSAFKLRVTCNISEEVTQIIQSVFDATVRILKKLEKEERKIAGSLLVACFTEMLRLMDVGHYQKLLGDFQNATKSKVRLSTLAINHISNPAVPKNFLNRVLLVFKDLITTSDYPADWTTMRLVTNNVMLTSIQYISEDLVTNFLNGPDFDKELWYNFFLLAVYFITQPELQLEKYSEAKSSMIKDKYQDMRVPFGVLINSLWNQLGPNKQHLIIEMIGPFLKVTMVRQTELRKATIPIFFDIIKCEFSLKGDLRRVESKMIHELDSLVIEHNGDVEYKEMFTS